MLKPVYAQADAQMQKSLEAFERSLATLRTGRANPALLSHLKVDYYGSLLPINQIGSISVPDARTLVVQSWDAAMLSAVEKAIRDSGLGLNPSNRGDALYIAIPVLTEERRKDIIKTARSYAEEARVAVRGARRGALDEIRKLERDKDISEDEAKRSHDEVQKITDVYVGKIDVVLELKQHEILGE